MSYLSRNGWRQFRMWSVFSVCVGAAYFYFRSNDDNSSQDQKSPDISVVKNVVENGVLVKRYCNYPLVAAESGLSRKALADAGLKFRGLSVLTRHGDRAPLSKFAEHLPVPFCGLRLEEDIDLYNSYIESLTSSKQQEALPPKLARLRKYPPTDTCQPGHLTVLGVVQMLKLGRHLRTLYADVWPFDPKNSNFYITSTIFSRTYQSCIAFISGFLGRQAEDLNLMASESTHFCTETWCQCPNMEKFNEHFYSYQNTFYQSNGQHVHPIVDTMKDVLKANSGDSLAYFDHVMGYACHGEQLPCLTEGNRACIEHPMVETLGSFLHTSYADLYKSAVTVQKSLIEALPVMVGWRKLLMNLNNDKTTNGFQYFSGHDVTLVPLLAVLGVFDGHIPPYASNLRVEFFEQLKNSQFYLRFIYNGVDITKNVALCQQNLERYGPYDLCKSQAVTDFIKLYLDENSKPTERFQNLCHP